MIIDVDPSPLTEKICSGSEEILKDLMVYNLRFNRGEFTPEQFHKLLIDLFHFDGDFKLFQSIWENIFSPNEDIVNYYRDLFKRGISIVLASNTDPIHYNYIVKRWGLDFLHSSFLSYEHSVIKPDLEFYHKLTQFGGLDPKDSIFIDDLLDNVNSAKKCGYHTIHHIENKQTIETIERFLQC